ncbi:PLP-dependent aminotransferase family protein [Nonomuraea sp. PA05]|uniref:aminotransferase-like domain-containing protein n=1 Tax=Nonomuraea sp. PA05 TaxID=2604466 RepID=UPI0016521BC8|nr:PLP-dependent aminotransferase family protein [Nonomuraea sp. PA05]
MRHPQRLSIPIHLERGLPEPLQDQLTAQLRRAIVRGQLAPRSRMPSTRTLSRVLGISRGVALAAFERLLAEGYITGRHGSGTYVCEQAGAAPRAAASGETLLDLRLDRPSTQGFPLAAWRAAWRRAGLHRPPLGGLPATGLPALRAAIAAHLRHARGLELDGHEVIVTPGIADALRLILRAQGGSDPVIALEDPAPPKLRAALSRLGTVLPLPVDGSGARTDRIPAACDVVVVLPERGDPLGTRLPLDRRHALTQWARDSGGLVLEPAFDGLFAARPEPLPEPLPAVPALGDTWSTAMVGSFAEVLTPTLRLAFAVVPRRLAGEIEQFMPAGPSITSQLAVTDLLRSGCVAGRMAELSAQYAAKRALVRQALEAYPHTRLLGARTGAAATLLLPVSVPAPSVAAALLARRVQVAELAAFHHPESQPGNGIVLSFGHLDGVSLRRALHALTRTLDEHRLARRTAA